jgi:putative peptidoglycan lipid II flippase
MKDARTPTLIQVAMVAVRVPLLLLVPVVVGPDQVVAGLMVVTSTTYVAGWVVGNLTLRRKLGTGGSGQATGTVLRMAAVSAVAALRGGLVVHLTSDALGTSVAGSLGTLVIGTVVIGIAVVAGAVVVKVPEVSGPVAGVRARLGHPRGSGGTGA